MGLRNALLGDPSYKSGYVDPRTGARRATPWIERTDDGIYTAANRNVWIYRVLDNVPMRFEDADALLDHGNRIRQLLADIGQTSIATPPFIQTAPDGFYRNIHVATIRWNHWPEPPSGTATPALANFLQEEILNFASPAQAVFIGVELMTGDARAKARSTNFFDFAKDMVNDLFHDNPTDYNRFERDLQFLNPILRRNDARTPTRDEMRQLEAWFANGSTSEPEIVAFPDHLLIDREDRIEFAALERLNQKAFRAPYNEWLSDTMDHPDGPSIISIRAELQPASDTRKALRKSIKARRIAERERQEANKEEMVEETEDFELTRLAEGMYAHSDADPALRNVSVVFGHRVDYDAEESYVDYLRHNYQMDVKPLTHAQIAALDEVQPGSAKRGSPFPLHVSLSVVAYAGIASFTDIGDPEGAFIGRGLPDGTPVYFDPLASSRANLPPATFIAGVPGSGKALTLRALLPTPTGAKRMGDIEVGDEVVGRDGKPCRVAGVWSHDSLQMFDVHLSDGQVIRACVDHQWVVSDKMARVAPGRPKRKAAVVRWEQTLAAADRLEALAATFDGDVHADTTELLALVSDQVPEAPWNTYIGIYAALERQGCPSEDHDVERAWDGFPEVTKSVPAKLWPTREALTACRAAWAAIDRPNGAAMRAARIAACDALLERGDLPDQETPVGVVRLLTDAGAPSPGERAFRCQVSEAVRGAGIEFVDGTTTVVAPATDGHTQVVTRRMWPTQAALKALAVELRDQAADRPSTEVEERVLTTGDMLAEGVAFAGTHSNFAIRVAEPLDLPEADLAVDPYVLGAWLGDGVRNTSTIASSTSRRYLDERDVDDQTHMIGRLTEVGHDVWPVKGRPDEIINVRGLSAGLREVGVLRDKHIPMAYLRASAEQRLALLQGLMDTDGTVDADGACNLTLTNKRLVHDALDLIRTLGIKASITEGLAVIVEDDPDRPGEKRRRATGPKWTVCFTTTRQVFTLPRKVARLPETVRATQHWLYITDIVPAPTEPGRCIQVDSPDHTYLTAGCVPTHNTYLAQHLAVQAALGGLRVSFLNPKGMDTLKSVIPYMESLGIDCEWTAISKLSDGGGEGMYDPFRYAGEPETAATIAANFITTVLDFDQEQRTALRHGLSVGAKNGAQCTGEALRTVLDMNPYVARQVRAFWESTPLFALCMGFEPKPRMVGEQRERLAGELGRFHLTEFDMDLNLPTAVKSNSEYSDAERIGLASVRAVTMANIGMLAGTAGGVFMMDEAHNFLSHPSTVSLTQKMMREGRSLNVAQIYISQLVSDLLSVGGTGASLESYISRAFALRMVDPVDAAAALRLIGYEPTEERVAQMREFGVKKTAAGIQPALGYYRDLQGRKSVVSLGPYSESFARAASTNIDDKLRREGVAEPA